MPKIATFTREHTIFNTNRDDDTLSLFFIYHSGLYIEICVFLPNFLRFYRKFFSIFSVISVYVENYFDV